MKVAHIFWDNSALSLLRLLSIVTFKKWNPDYRIILWRPLYDNPKKTWTTFEQGHVYTGKDYLEELVEIVDSVKYWSCPNKTLNNIAQSDWCRLYGLYEYGGVYFDTDTLWMASIGTVTEGVGICIRGGVPQIGIITVSEECDPVIGSLLELCEVENGKGYESYGSNLWRAVRNQVKCLDICEYNPLRWDEVSCLLSGKLLPKARCIHWYGGALHDIESRLSGMLMESIIRSLT